MTALIEKIRVSVTSLKAALLQPAPETLQAHLPALDEAIQGLCALTRLDSAGNGAASRAEHRPAALLREHKRDLKALALDLAACHKLIEHGLNTTRVLAAILAGSHAGYSSTGSPPPLTARTTLSLQG